MKFAIGFIVGAIIVGGLFFYFRGSLDRFFAVDRCIQAGGTFDYGLNECRASSTTPTILTEEIDLPLALSNARITVPDTEGVVVTLENGAGEYTAEEEEGVVTILDVRTALSSGETNFAVAPFTVSRGGTGTFVYIGLFAQREGMLSSLDQVLLGDRVKVENIEVTGDGTFTVSYLDRKVNEPMAAAPSVAKTISMSVIDEKLMTASAADERIEIDVPQVGATIISPLTVTGRARGQWYFEASFPVIVTDANGKVLAEVPAQAQGEWMTEEFVPFKAVIAFPPQEKGTQGRVIFKRDNASGLPEHDAAVEIPVVF